MAKLYGTLQANRGEATRCGSDYIRASAQSYEGSVIVELLYNDNKDLIVKVETNNGSSCYGDWNGNLFKGTFEEFKDLLKLNRDIKAGKVKIVRHRAKKETK